MKRVESVVAQTGCEPRPYQFRIVHKISDMFSGRFQNGAGDIEPAAKSVMVESPTGSGKTVMGLLGAKTLQSEMTDLVVGWVAMRRNLLGQAAKENRKWGINVRDIHFVSMFDKHPSALIQARKDGRPVLMCVDEAQHDAASSMAHLHNLVEPDHILGLTATPFRTDRMKLCFEKVIRDAGIHALIQDGYLSPYHHYTIPRWDAETVADHYCADPERWGKSIFYFVNLDECFKLGAIFRERQIKHEIVTGSSNRDTQIERFEQGEVECLINCMVLTEGFDCPSLKTAFVRDSGKGPTMQMGGRTFRKFPDLPFKQIVQSKQTRWPFVRTAMPEQQFLWVEDEWRSLKVNPHLNQINMNARMAIAQTEVEMPKFITDRKGRGRRTVRF